ncbi:MAG: thermonuclease family protein [Chloroflexi bacterium]|nr:thermonuclease family protein [Chloroflexota bacterium]
MRSALLLVLVLALLSGCEIVFDDSATTPSGSSPQGETALVTRIIDGDTIDVRIGDVGYRVRYVGVNTPEDDEPCYAAARDANAALVEGQTVTLVQDVSNTDRFGRLLRFVYVGSTFVNQELMRQGYAEAVLYQPDDAFHSEFVQLEDEAARAGRGCHPTGIFDDGSATR